MLRLLPAAIAAIALLGAGAAAQPLAAPAIFAPGIISGPANDGTPTFTPDGKTLYFTRSGSGAGTILVSHLENGAWSKPEIAPFSGVWNDQHPAISPDGSQLVFVSTRPVPHRTDRVAHLWMMTRTGSAWSTPVHLPSAVNIGRAIFAPSIAADGTIYFLSISKNGTQRVFQLYRSRYANGSYEQAEPLAFSTSQTADVDPEIAPDQSYLVFASSGRRAGDTNEHLYIVRRNGNGWGEAATLRYPGDDAASNDNEPRISRDGKSLYFSSDRTAGRKSEPWDNGNANVWIAPFSAAGMTAEPASSY